TFRYFDKVLRPRGVRIRFVDMTSRDALTEALSERTRLVWFETPTNPWLKLVDIARVAEAARESSGARGEHPIVVVDNTFASPAIQRPIELGADIAFHSATKYLAGHSDTVNGVVATGHAHPQAELARNQMRVAGGMVSFIPAAGGHHGRDAAERAIALCEATRVFALAESLGGVESLIEVPAVMTHASVAGSPLQVPDA